MGAIAVAIALGLEVGGVHFWGRSSLCLGVWILLVGCSGWVMRGSCAGFVRAGRYWLGVLLLLCFFRGCRVLWPGILVASGSIPVHAQVLMFVLVLRTLYHGFKVAAVWLWLAVCILGAGRMLWGFGIGSGSVPAESPMAWFGTFLCRNVVGWRSGWEPLCCGQFGVWRPMGLDLGGLLEWGLYFWMEEVGAFGDVCFCLPLASGLWVAAFWYGVGPGA